MKTDNVIATLGNYQLSYRTNDDFLQQQAQQKSTPFIFVPLHILLSIGVILSITAALLRSQVSTMVIIAISVLWVMATGNIHAWLDAFKLTPITPKQSTATTHNQHTKRHHGYRLIFIIVMLGICVWIRHLFYSNAPKEILLGATALLMGMVVPYYFYYLFQRLYVNPNAVVAQAADTSLAHDG